MNITRSYFLKRVFQVILASLLGIIALILSRRTVTGNECSDCPGKGICSGGTDCSKFLTERR